MRGFVLSYPPTPPPRCPPSAPRPVRDETRLTFFLDTLATLFRARFLLLRVPWYIFGTGEGGEQGVCVRVYYARERVCVCACVECVLHRLKDTTTEPVLLNLLLLSMSLKVVRKPSPLWSTIGRSSPVPPSHGVRGPGRFLSFLGEPKVERLKKARRRRGARRRWLWLAGA